MLVNEAMEIVMDVLSIAMLDYGRVLTVNDAYMTAISSVQYTLVLIITTVNTLRYFLAWHLLSGV